jgi:hypothetical protein
VNRSRKEEQRRAKAMPARTEGRLPAGCRVAFAVYLGVPVLLFVSLRWVFGLVLSVPGWIGAAIWAYNRSAKHELLRRVRNDWQPVGIRCLVIYSESPLWAEYIRSRWLSALQGRALVWNRSDNALPGMVVHQLCSALRRIQPHPGRARFSG